MPEEQIQQVPLAEIELTQFLRKEIDQTRLAELTRNIEQNGLLYPIRLIRREKLFVWDGTHRVLAFHRLGQLSIPGIIDERELSEAELLTLGLSANNQRTANTPLEQAEAIAKLLGIGWSAQQVADRLSISPSTVSKLLACLKLPEPVRLQLHRGEIGLAAAYELTKTPPTPPPPKSRPAKADRAKASRLRLPVASYEVVVTGDELDLAELIDLLTRLLKESRQAQKQSLDVKTFASILRDKAESEFIP